MKSGRTHLFDVVHDFAGSRPVFFARIAPLYAGISPCPERAIRFQGEDGFVTGYVFDLIHDFAGDIDKSVVGFKDDTHLTIVSGTPAPKRTVLFDDVGEMFTTNGRN